VERILQGSACNLPFIDARLAEPLVEALRRGTPPLDPDRAPGWSAGAGDPTPGITAKLARSPFVTLRSLTNAHSFRYHVPLARGEEGSVRAVWDYLRKRPGTWHMIELERFETGYPADTELLSAARSTGHSVGVWTGACLQRLTLEGVGKDYHSSLKPKFRSNLRNRLKRLGALGAIEYELVRDRNGCDAPFEDAFTIEQAGWKGRRERHRVRPGAEALLHRMGRDGGRPRLLRLWFLRLGGRRVAFEYNLEYNRNLYCMKIGYDPGLHPYSAGQILKAAILENAFEHGLGVYHFLGMMDESKGDWTSDARLLQWAYVYNGSPLSRLHHAQKFVLKPWLKRMLGR